MSSKWVELRDSVVNTLKLDEVTEELKQDLTVKIINTVFPSVESVVNDFSKKIREQAPNESGWCRIRDGIVLPMVIEGLFYIVKTVLTKSLDEKNVKLLEEVKK